MGATGKDVLTGAVLNFVFGLIGVALFCFLRVWPKSARFFDPKRETPAVLRKPLQLGSGYFSWIVPTWKYSEPDIIRENGLDTAMYLRLVKFCLELFLWVSAWCLVTVLPTNVTDNNVDYLMTTSDDYKFSDFDKLSLANVDEGSQRMWVHLVSVYVITFIALKLLWRYSKESVLLRIQFLGNSRPGGSTHTVLVTDIPAIMDATAAHVKSLKSASKAESKRAKSKVDLDSADVEAGSAASAEKVLVQDRTSSVMSEPAPVVAGGGDAPTSPLHIDPKVALKAEGPHSEDSSLPGRAGATGVRQRKTFNYDLTTTSLDPTVTAARKLEAGVSAQDLVANEFKLVYGPEVREVQMVRDQDALHDLVSEYEQRKLQLEDYLDGIADKQSRDEPLPPAKVTLLFPDAWAKEKYGKGMMKKVDGLPFWRDRLTWLEQQIEEKQAAAQSLMWPAAFVTFKSRVMQSVSATGLHSHNEQAWRVQGAPEPGDLIWANLGMTQAMRTSANTVMWVLFWLMTCFYMIPVTAIQGLIDVPKLTENVPGLSAFTTNPVVSALLAAIVPGLVLKIFLALVPMILAIMVRKSGAVSTAQVDLGVVSRFFIFQAVVVFAGSTLAGSFFSQASQWINDPSSVISVLGTAIPMATTFFISYAFVNFGVVLFGFARIVGVILMWVFEWLASSPKAKARAWQEQYTSCGTSVTGHTLLLLVGVVYSCINPIIAPAVLIYFAAACLVEKYNNIWVYRRKYESGGQLWVRVLNQTMTVLYIFQLCMIGLLAIKKFKFSPVLIPVLLPTIAFHISVLNLFNRPWTITSLHDAAELDLNDRAGDEDEDKEKGEVCDAYLSPVFKVQPGALATLLEKAAAIEPVVVADVERRLAEEAAKKAAKKGGKAKAEETTPVAAPTPSA